MGERSLSDSQSNQEFETSKYSPEELRQKHRNTSGAKRENEESKKYEIILTTQDEESKYESGFTSARNIFGIGKDSNPDS